MKILNDTLKTIFYYIALFGLITTSDYHGKNREKGAKGTEKSQRAAPRLGQKAHKRLESFSVAVVGKQVITDQDVKSRMAMEAVFLRRSITPKNYVKMYTDAALALVNEARQNQAPNLLMAMAKKSLQTQSVTVLLPEEIKKEVDERILAMAKGNAMTLKEFRSHLGPHYDPFYKRQESMTTFQRFLMLKWGSRAMRNIADNAITKARKKWQAKQKSVQYRVGEIVIYNRRNDAHQKILEIESLLQRGEVVFSEMAYQESEAKTNENGGDCGWNVLEYFDRPVQDFLRKASIGDISPIIALPTARNPEKWVVVLYRDQRNPEADKSDKDAKDPGDDFFRNILFGTELERLSKIEMEELKKSYPSTLNIPKNLTMPSDFNTVMIQSDQSNEDSSQEEPQAEDTKADEAVERGSGANGGQREEDPLSALGEDSVIDGEDHAETDDAIGVGMESDGDDGSDTLADSRDEAVDEVDNGADNEADDGAETSPHGFGQTPFSLKQPTQGTFGPFAAAGGF